MGVLHRKTLRHVSQPHGSPYSYWCIMLGDNSVPGGANYLLPSEHYTCWIMFRRRFKAEIAAAPADMRQMFEREYVLKMMEAVAT